MDLATLAYGGAAAAIFALGAVGIVGLACILLSGRISEAERRVGALETSDSIRHRHSRP